MDYFLYFSGSIFIGLSVSKVIKDSILLERIKYYLQIVWMVHNNHIILTDDKYNMLTDKQIQRYMKLDKINLLITKD